MEKRKSSSTNSSSSSTTSSSVTKRSKRIKIAPKEYKVSNSSNCKFVGEPIAADKAKEKWPHRYQNGESLENAPKSKDQTDENFQAAKHYNQAAIEGVVYKIGDDAYVEAGIGEKSYVCRIVEFFEGKDDGSLYFTAQWFYRARDTVIKQHGGWIDKKRIFLSEVKNDNPLDCLLKKLKIVQLPLDVDEHRKSATRANCDYYYDMMYLVEFSSFVAIPATEAGNKKGAQSDSLVSNDKDNTKVKPTMTLLDLYSGCGGMSTGLSMGANLAGVDLVTKWAVDFNESACKSLQLNHPETKVRFEMAENFLALMKQWENLYHSYLGDDPNDQDIDEEEDDMVDDDGDLEDGVFEVDRIMDVRYDPQVKENYSGIEFQVSWKGYGRDADKWEPLEDLTGCAAKVKEFVISAYKSKLIPLPGDVDVICGGPPCQGISGLNRHRKTDKPLEDPKNKQLIVYMDIIEYLKPRFVLMENVVDILIFAKGYLARYGLGRLVGLDYQARIGMMAAGAFGLPQYRMRMFMWAARPSEILPQYPLPTHHAVRKGSTPREFELNVVAYEEGNDCADLQKALLLEDAISDLPPVKNEELRDEMTYTNEPKTEFQKFIRLKKAGNEASGSEELLQVLYDHIPYKLNKDDFQRTIRIPKCKGANFRDLPGVIVDENNKAKLDPRKPRRMLASGKPLVPDYALTFRRGTSTKPFGRIWWDEVVPTVVTRPQPHNHIILHPMQNRVLTIRENARLQGFPDYYKLVGPVKERYSQVGNAVATPVAKALGYSLGITSKKLCGNGPLLTLPKNFPRMLEQSDDQEVV